ncbi:hypothetical protein EAG_08490 [Camponotus floridanus]|uniref:Uncharacterized protein n=1 Tax=Camponotus floridanus TaxID=104421 RepID=E2AX19_CAMFO|nr:hypothetical protein EAG_08490 [Camponotus floridanus]
MESRRACGSSKEDRDGRMDKEKERGRIVVELREIRKVEELVKVMKRMASGQEKMEETEQGSKRSKVRKEEKDVEAQKSRVEGW